MLVDTDKIIGITELQKNLPKIIRNIKDNSPLFVARRNEISAIILPVDEYNRMTELIELLEYMEISDNIKSRMKNYNSEKNISWDKIKTDYGL